ncbi:MAG: hypothetical protein M5R40_29415 [Anaerolineae bacterium]|nr:hypothetical protein [Anaerolineae bacterium]
MLVMRHGDAGVRLRTALLMTLPPLMWPAMRWSAALLAGYVPPLLQRHALPWQHWSWRRWVGARFTTGTLIAPKST